MARRDQSHPDNVAGPWFIDTRCVGCDAARQWAPGLIGMDSSGLSVLSRQPETPDQTAALWRASVACPTKSIGTDEAAHPPADVFPFELTAGVYALGHNSPSSFGGHSYLVAGPAGNLHVALDPDARTRPGVVVSRFEAPLIFSNAHAFARDLKAQLVAAEPTPELLIIDGEVISEIDNTGAESLVTVASEIRAAGIEVRLARIHHNVYEALEHAALIDELGTDSFMATPDDALPNEE